MSGTFYRKIFYNVRVVYPGNFLSDERFMSEEELVVLADKFPENIYFSVGI